MGDVAAVGMEARPTRASVVSDFLFAPASARLLGLVRIATFGALAGNLMWMWPPQLAALPTELVAPQDFGARIAALLPVTSGPVLAGTVIAIGVSLAAAAGWRTRITAPTAAVLAFWLLGVLQLYGKVSHFHHMLWFAVLLAVSPCADALSWDARRRSKPPPSARYGFPIRIMWLLLGILYLSAALPKLEVGLDWVVTDNLRNAMWSSWYKKDFTPPLRFDEWAWFYRPASGGVLLFELGFLPAMFWRRTRRIAAVVGVVFHASTWPILGIYGFVTGLLPLYVVFLGDQRRRMRDEAQPRQVIVGSTLLAGVLAAGLTGHVDGWPFASYPPFGRYSESVGENVLFIDDEQVEGGLMGMVPGRWRFVMDSAAASEERLEALAQHIGAEEIEVVGRRVHADPDDTRVLEERVLWSWTQEGGFEEP